MTSTLNQAEATVDRQAVRRIEACWNEVKLIPKAATVAKHPQYLELLDLASHADIAADADAQRIVRYVLDRLISTGQYEPASRITSNLGRHLDKNECLRLVQHYLNRREYTSKGDGEFVEMLYQHLKRESVEQILKQESGARAPIGHRLWNRDTNAPLC